MNEPPDRTLVSIPATTDIELVPGVVVWLKASPGQVHLAFEAPTKRPNFRGKIYWDRKRSGPMPSA